MLALKKVAITGGVGSGKSTVAGLFKDFGAYVVDTDKIVHWLIENDKEIQKKIIDLLGPQIVCDEKIDRAKIAKIVFNNFSKLNQLEKVLHPRVREEVNKIYKNISKEKKWNLFVVEIPLLFETKSDIDYEVTLAVNRPIDSSLKAFKDPQTFMKRSQRQWSCDEKAAKADYVLTNTGNLEDLKKSFQKIYSQITI